MNALRPSAKAGIVFLGVIIAWAISWFAMELRQRATQGPDAQAAAGMYAFGDLVVGVVVFGVLALLPLGLALFWLRPVARFWSALGWAALLFALTGVAALVANFSTGTSPSAWAVLALARVGIMPLSLLMLLTCALFAPQPRYRWPLLAAAASDGAMIAGIVLVKFVLPSHGSG